MQFITTGNRIAVENFVLGDLYTITFTNGTYINSACIGIGDNFVTFQRNEPELLFSLTMATAELVSSIELYAGGSGTNNYNDLSNKPQIGGVELVGNKSLSDLGIQATISDIDTIRSGAAAGATAVQPAALAYYQPVISDLDTIRAGAAAGATAVQPADMTSALAAKQDALSSAQLAAVNSGITLTDVAQISTNENNILYNTFLGRKNALKLQFDSSAISAYGLTFTKNADGTLSVSGTYNGSAPSYAPYIGNATLPAGTYMLSGCPSGGGESTWQLDMISPSYVNDTGSGAQFTLNQTTAIQIRCRIATTETLNKTFYPMITLKSIYDTDSTFERYAMNNAEITNWIESQ